MTNVLITDRREDKERQRRPPEDKRQRLEFHSLKSRNSNGHQIWKSQGGVFL